MNSLSWMIYLIDVVTSLRGACVGLLIAILFCCGIYSAYNAIENDKAVLAPLKWFVISAALIFILIVIPSRGTMYAIAATEVGDRLLSTPVGKEMSSDAMRAVQSWIKSQIKEDSK